MDGSPGHIYMKTMSLSLVLFALPCFAQEPATPTFDVASVKISADDSRYSGPPFQVAHGSLTTHGFALRVCLVLAYQMGPAQIQGPDWLNNVSLDITAKAAGPASEQQVYLMLQKLLADRMGVKVHKEMKEMAVYVMTVAKGGPKFKETEGEGPMTATKERGAMSIKGISLFELAAEFSGKLLDRPVIDQTGLKGRYDIRVDMSPMRAAYPGAGERGTDERSGNQPPDRADQIGAFMAVLRDQLGLKLDGGKQPVDVLVVDHAERSPTGN
jgi:uncharacterized protein (TIGR03435 family)